MSLDLKKTSVVLLAACTGSAQAAVRLRDVVAETAPHAAANVSLPAKADVLLEQAEQDSAAIALQKTRLVLHGSVRSDVLVPQTDLQIGTTATTEHFLTNSAAQFVLTYGRWEAGLRYEYQQHPLPGYEPDFAGQGLPFAYARGRMGRFDLTLGSYYEQFGSGLVLRTYEEPTLGIDNHLRGLRLLVDAGAGVQLKALVGRQRRFWRTTTASIFGLDGEWTLPARFMPQSRWVVGASWVAKDEAQDHLSRIISNASSPYPLRQQLVQPRWVHAVDVRVAWHHRGWQTLVEYAHKSQDPSFDNHYTYAPGSALLVSTSYAHRGLSALLQAKRTENMSFRSQRSGALSGAMLNHLPPFTPQPTYALTTLYPYATQNVPGEWAFQGEFSYTLPKRSRWGGKYGTQLKLHASQIYALGLQPSASSGISKGSYSAAARLAPQDGTSFVAEGVETVSADAALMGTDGVATRGYFAMGGTLYREIGVDLERRLSRPLRLHLAYLHQRYDKTAIEGKGGIINSHIAIGELRWRMSQHWALRTELQYLHTKEDQGDWASALVELTLWQRWVVTLADQYNAHVYSAALHREAAVHYLQGLLTYNVGQHRLQLGYGRTRAGYNCAGGVCRYIPAQRGLTFSYNLTF